MTLYVIYIISVSVWSLKNSYHWKLKQWAQVLNCDHEEIYLSTSSAIKFINTIKQLTKRAVTDRYWTSEFCCKSTWTSGTGFVVAYFWLVTSQGTFCAWFTGIFLSSRTNGCKKSYSSQSPPKSVTLLSNEILSDTTCTIKKSLKMLPYYILLGWIWQAIVGTH